MAIVVSSSQTACLPGTYRPGLSMSEKQSERYTMLAVCESSLVNTVGTTVSRGMEMPRIPQNQLFDSAPAVAALSFANLYIRDIEVVHNGHG